jgi:hypothetical protein
VIVVDAQQDRVKPIDFGQRIHPVKDRLDLSAPAQPDLLKNSVKAGQCGAHSGWTLAQSQV